MISTVEIERELLESLRMPERIRKSRTHKVIPETRPVEYRQNFEIWTLTASAVNSYMLRFGSDFSNPPPLDDLMAQDTNQIHHQIRLGNRKLAFGRSKKTARGPEGRMTLDLKGLFVSDTALRIDEDFKWVENQSPTAMREENLSIRLLLAPEYQITAFWVVGQGTYANTIVPVKYPPEFRNHFRNSKTISSQDFLVALYDVQPITGIKW